MGPNDLALLVTVGDFSAEARVEATRANATPVALLNGDGVVDIMLEHEIGVTSGTLEIYEISDLGLSNGSLD